MTHPVLENLDNLEDELVSQGFHAMSPWWRSVFTDFYQSGRKQLVIRAGRRAGKSSSVCRVLVLEALFGEHDITPGDVGVIPVVATDRSTAYDRVRTVASILEAIGEPHEVRGETIALHTRPVEFRVYPPTIRAVGFTSIALFADELALWRDAESGSNPAAEVLAALRPSLMTMPNSRRFLISAPWGPDDAHARAFDAGDNDHQMVRHAATWEANPTITEADTRAEEPDERIWRRAYAAIPQAANSTAFDGDAIDACFTHPRPYGLHQRWRMVIDSSSGKRDQFTYALVRWVIPRGSPTYLEVSRIGAVPGGFWAAGTMAAVVARLAEIAKAHNVANVHGDQRESAGLRSLFEAHRLQFNEHPWTAKSKPLAVERVRRWMSERSLAIEEHDGMRRELRSFQERITSSGQITFDGGRFHDDFVALLITAAHANLSHQLVHEEPDTSIIYCGNPFARSHSRIEARSPEMIAALRRKHGITPDGELP